MHWSTKSKISNNTNMHFKAIVFNKFVEDNLNDQAAEKDARDFIKTAGLCN